MDNCERAAYIKGLIEGLDINDSTKEGKVLLAISELLTDMANDMEDLGDALGDLEAQVDEIDEDLGILEEEVYCDDGCKCGGNCGCDCDDDDDFDFMDDDFDDEEEEYFEVTCPECGDVIELNGEMLDEGSLECPNCGSMMVFDLENIEDVEGDEESEENTL
ncbi:MAG: hypothetical protein Q4C42_00100 [Clostridia bacterium]|nr:hypothetical protein [Clostridia bacterium]